MAALGEQFPGRKIGKDDTGDEGVGELVEPGPLDLDSGKVVLRKRRPTTEPPAGTERPQS